MVRTHVSKDAGHPWDGMKRPGFDILEIQADSVAEMDAAVAQAKAKFWQPWLIGTDEATGIPCGAMFKPCGIMKPWHDSPERPHPGCPRESVALAQGTQEIETFIPYESMSESERTAFDTRQGIAPGDRAKNDALLENERSGQKTVSQLKFFEITAAGFDASTDATDDLVFWVAAPTEDLVKKAIMDTGAAFCGEIDHIELVDADFTLPAQEMQLSSMLLQTASDHRNSSRPVHSRRPRP